MKRLGVFALNASIVGMVVLLMLSWPGLAAATPNFIARGNEPFWNIEITDAGITFRTMEGETITVLPKPEPENVDGVETYLATVDGQPFSLMVSGTVCVDTMSGMTFPKTVTVAHGERKFSGCGGDPASLLHGEWAIEQIEGKAIVAKSEPTLAFGTDGRVYGNGSCNRYFGGYELTGEGLAFSELGSTKMACEQPLMDQEFVFLQILGAVSRFEFDSEGKLVLHSDDGTLVASRK